MTVTSDLNKLILLVKLVNKLSEIDYYKTFAKTFLRSIDINKINSPNNYVEEMFIYFINNGDLNYYLEDNHSYKEFHGDNLSAALKSLGTGDKKIYISIDDLKKLYANKCIVFPNSLIKEIQQA